MPEELAAQNKIVKAIGKAGDPDLLLPIRIVDKIPRDRELERAGRVSVGRFGSAGQYQHLARYAILEGIIIEVCLNLISPSFHWPYGPNRGFRNFIGGNLEGEGHDRRVRYSKTPYLNVFRNLRFPVSDLRKEDMHEIANGAGFAEILKNTFSCWHPKGGKPCGECFNCKERYLK
jgi:hypothetical protein